MPLSFCFSRAVRALLIAFTIVLSACSRPPAPDTVVLNTPHSQLTSLVWLTRELGLFSRHRLDVQLQAYPSGKRALQALLDGHGQLALTAETPFVIAAFTHPRLRLFATLGQSDNEIRILARADRGIHVPADLRDHVIATQRGSAVHFFLSSFLLYHGIPEQAVRIRFLKAEALAPAFIQGSVDAISMRDPILHAAASGLEPGQITEFAEPGLYTKTYNLVGPADYPAQNPGVLERLLQALDAAARYAEAHPRDTIERIARAIDVPASRITREWDDMRLAVSLNQGLLTTLQEEARWVIENRLVEPIPDQVPDFLARLDPGPLSRAVPDAVGLIGIDSQ